MGPGPDRLGLKCYLAWGGRVVGGRGGYWLSAAQPSAISYAILCAKYIYRDMHLHTYACMPAASRAAAARAAAGSAAVAAVAWVQAWTMAWP